MLALDDILNEKLATMEKKHLRRHLADTKALDAVRVVRDGKTLINFCSNNYLGLTHHPKVIAAAEAALQEYGAGSGASRLVTGNHPLHGQLEASLAQLKNTEAACVFGSGYLANIGIIPALMGKSDLILIDRLAHACLIDGALFSGAKVLRFKHNDMAHLDELLSKHRGDYKHCLIITDGVFSMDGDVAPVDDICKLATQHNAWSMTDDAHALGKSTTSIDIKMGTLSKAIGSYGGYVAGSKTLIDFITTSTRSLIFTTALPPSTIAAAHAAVELIVQGDIDCDAPILNAAKFCELVGLPEPKTPIVPLILGDAATALNAAAKLEKTGFLVSAIRPPTVPDGSSRLRFTFSSEHSDEEIEALAHEVRNIE